MSDLLTVLGEEKYACTPILHNKRNLGSLTYTPTGWEIRCRLPGLKPKFSFKTTSKTDAHEYFDAVFRKWLKSFEVASSE